MREKWNPGKIKKQQQQKKRNLEKIKQISYGPTKCINVHLF